MFVYLTDGEGAQIVMYCIRIRNRLYRDIIVIVDKILGSYHILSMSAIPTPIEQHCQTNLEIMV